MGKAEDTKHRIIELVAPIFNKKGYWATTLTDLTEITGLTKGALYGNFKNKDEIALAAFEYNTSRVSKELNETLKNYSSSLTRLFAYIDFYIAFYDTMIEMGGCPFMNAAVDSDDLNSPIFRNVQLKFTKWMESIENIVKEGKANGDFVHTVNEMEIAALIVSFTEGSILLSKTLNNPTHIYNNLLFLKKQLRELLLAEK